MTNTHLEVGGKKVKVLRNRLSMSLVEFEDKSRSWVIKTLIKTVEDKNEKNTL